MIKEVQMIDAWRNHLNDLAKRSPIDSAHFFEFKSTLAYGPSDLEIEDRKVEEQIVERTQMPTPQRTRTRANHSRDSGSRFPRTSSSSSHSR